MSTERPDSPEQWSSPSLLETKLHPPSARPHTVARDRLVEQLRANEGIRLVLVAAPAGYGKTTLLGSWRELESGRRSVAWVTLDERDNDPVVLWSHVLEALRRACPGFDVPVEPDRVGAARIGDVVLPHIVNGLTAQSDAGLVLDDFHLLSGGPARDGVAWLVEHVPATFRFVLSTRKEPALPLGALRARGELIEVRADDLGFTREEGEALLNGHLGLELETDVIDGLVDRTEGWPAGLYLAALSLQGVSDRRSFASAFGGSDRYVVDFLVDEVLDAHDAPTQELMLRSSVLGRMSGPLCDAVLERTGTADLLAELARTNLFLLPLDGHGEWYRFHHLFAQLLRVELEHREPGLAPELHGRAMAWYREHGVADDAILHALEAGAYPDAGALIAEVWVDYAVIGREATVLAWLDRIPPDILEQDSRLLLVSAWALALAGRREQAAESIASLERLEPWEAGPLPDGFSSVEASLATLHATIPWGDMGLGIESGRRAVELETPASRWWPVATGSLGACLYYSGEFDEAERWLAESTKYAAAHGNLRIAVTALAHHSLVAGELQRLDDQSTLADEAVQLARLHGLEEVDGEVFVALGAARAARGELEEALEVLERAVRVLRRSGHPRPLAEALIRQAGVLRSLARPEVEATIEEARAAVDACPDPRSIVERLAALEPRRQTRPHDGETALSERELTILRMLTGSLSEREIGRELYLSHNTIHSHTQSIYRKLGASSRSQAVAHARALRLI